MCTREKRIIFKHTQRIVGSLRSAAADSLRKSFLFFGVRFLVFLFYLHGDRDGDDVPEHNLWKAIHECCSLHIYILFSRYSRWKRKLLGNIFCLVGVQLCRFSQLVVSSNNTHRTIGFFCRLAFVSFR